METSALLGLRMTADSEKMHWLCSELSKHLEKMITQVRVPYFTEFGVRGSFEEA